MDRSDNPPKRHKPNPRTAVQSSPPLEAPAPESATFCNRCKSIPWAQLAVNTPNGPASSTKAWSIKVTDSHEQLKAAPCKLCRALALIKPAELDAASCQLRVFSARAVFGRVASGVQFDDESILDSTLVGIKHTRESYKSVIDRGVFSVLLDDVDPASLHFGPRRVDSKTIDFDLVKDWIAHCSAKHSKLPCPPPGAHGVDGLRVLDCSTRSVVQAPPECRYIALSYVWGDSQPYQSQNSALPPFPRVVEDCIQLTLALGYRYLWVDRYCISQADESKHEQIRQMNKIYAGSQLTVIAAAGRDAHYGLPGVSRNRQEQLRVEIDGVSLLQVFPHQAAVVNRSVWAQRGWTFQECYLAKRRLIVTDHQVSFLCNEVHLSESVNRAPFSLSPFDSAPFLGLIPSPGKPRMNTGTGQVSQPTKGVGKIIAAYSARSLSYESDIMSAFLGILAFLAERDMHHIWGVPFDRDKGLLLDWYHEKPCRPRTGFPTWSWTGWAGSAIVNDAYSSSSRSDMWISDAARTDSKLILSKREKKFDERYQALPEYRYVPPATAPHVLHLTARVVKLSFRHVEWTGDQLAQPTVVRMWTRWADSGPARKETFKPPRRSGLHVRFPLAPDIVALPYVYLDDDTALTGPGDGSVFGAVLEGFWRCILVLKPGQQDGSFSRVGIIPVQLDAGTNKWGTTMLPTRYEDDMGGVLDEVDLNWQSAMLKPLWLENQEERTLSLM